MPISRYHNSYHSKGEDLHFNQVSIILVEYFQMKGLYLDELICPIQKLDKYLTEKTVQIYCSMVSLLSFVFILISKFNKD